jgi:5'-methylthioadenosine phosphorylase
MSLTIACIAGEEIHRQLRSGRIEADRVEPPATPFGRPDELFRMQRGQTTLFLLARHGLGVSKGAPNQVNYRANLYALKELGAEHILAWGPAGAITHNMAVGDGVVLHDVIDKTCLRPRTFFESTPLGYLRQFPVFCPVLGRQLGEVLAGLGLSSHQQGVAVIGEGPRLETPAEIRCYANWGAQVVSHTFVPEVFLARELQMCYVGLAYVVNYAETGSRHRPFVGGGLFTDVREPATHRRLVALLGQMVDVCFGLVEALEGQRPQCACGQSMEENIRRYNLPEDWREWFGDRPGA